MDEEIFIPIVMFIAMFGIVYVYLTTRNRERLAMIEKGVDAKLFKREPAQFVALKIGMFLVGIGVGVLVGNIFDNMTNLHEGVAYISMILLFGGGSLLTFYFLEKRLTRNK